MNEAVALLDQWLSRVSDRELFSAAEVTDLLLDFRTALTREPEAVVDEAETVPEPEPEPQPV